MILKLNVRVELDSPSLELEQAASRALHRAAGTAEDTIADMAGECRMLVTHAVTLITHPCPCGSGRESEWEYDAKGIELGRMCPVCKAKRLAGYRTEVLTDRSYTASEPIEPE